MFACFNNILSREVIESCSWNNFNNFENYIISFNDKLNIILFSSRGWLEAQYSIAPNHLLNLSPEHSYKHQLSGQSLMLILLKGSQISHFHAYHPVFCLKCSHIILLGDYTFILKAIKSETQGRGSKHDLPSSSYLTVLPCLL